MRAAGPVTALRIAPASFIGFLHSHPAAQLQVLRSVARKLRSATQRRIETSGCDARRRLARVLYELAAEYGRPRPDGSVLLELSLSQRALGSLAGVAVSTTERVLRETTIPVLATPPTDQGPRSFADIRARVGRVLTPVDLTSASQHHLQVARAIAEALQVPVLAASVVEPVRSPLAAKLHLPSIEVERRARAEDALAALMATMPAALHAEALIAYGDPAEEIAKLARDRRAGLIVIGLQGSPMLGPHMGSVTFRVLCLARVLVLALPPAPTPAA